MNTQAQPRNDTFESLPAYRSILLAVDSSDHSNRSIREAAAVARLSGAEVTGVHVYAAQLHDQRFRQMEGGLPEQFQEEQELERQRDVHDDLITRGLGIISDSYLDQVERHLNDSGIVPRRRALEGKNYRELVGEANGGDYDLLVLGALGLGRVEGSRLGTVCRRTARRASIDTLVIKELPRSISSGPIVVAVDGSPKAYGGLLSALGLAAEWRVPVKVVAAFDPYYHYIAFNRIAGVLSEEAGKVFRFQDQEKLHEEIIDSGLAKIYQGHLSVAASLARDRGLEVETVLLDGKPHDVIRRYLNKARPSLLVMGRTGIHADDELDIGGNAEQLLEDAPCAVLLSAREHCPRVDRLAAVSTSWTKEAEARITRVPSFVRSMARMAILRYAQERGHTVITERLVEEATAKLMPGRAEQAMAEIVQAHDAGQLDRNKDYTGPIRWSDAATAGLLTVKDLALRGSLSLKAEKKARAEGAGEVSRAHIDAFLEVDSGQWTVCSEGSEPDAKSSESDPGDASTGLHWQAAALARLARVPEGFMREKSRERIEDHVRAEGATEITLALAEAGLARARQSMEQNMQVQAARDTAGTGRCPFHQGTAGPERAQDAPGLAWGADAENRLLAVPQGFCRDMTRKAAETLAVKSGLKEVKAEFLSGVLGAFEKGSGAFTETLPWGEDARARIQRAPDMVRGMLAREIEGWARRNGQDRVTHAAVDAVKAQWQSRGVFHLDPDDPRNS
ncbi:MAG: universal stress protein [Pseudomonadota bacterium]|nr:universal stress protein [Pseudomonadota bacterium]